MGEWESCGFDSINGEWDERVGVRDELMREWGSWMRRDKEELGLLTLSLSK